MVSMTARRECWRATFNTTGMEHSLTSATGAVWERAPWHATARTRALHFRWIAWEAVLLTHGDGTEDSARSSLNFPTNASYDEVRMILLNWAR
jgi:hypothetical protein